MKYNQKPGAMREQERAKYEAHPENIRNAIDPLEDR
jgi:hypothetical protein